MNARCLGGPLDLLVARIRLREAQVVAYGSVEQVRLLRDDADELGQGPGARAVESFGWPSDRNLDLGDISGARGMEMYLPLWLRLFSTFGTGQLNIHVAR